MSTGLSSLRWTGRTYLFIALAYTAFVVYGSLVPLRFRPVDPVAAVERFRQVVSTPIAIESNTDLATNFLLFVPLGYLVLAALRTDRTSWMGHTAAGAATMVAAAAFSASVEFTQIFFPGRTLALSDIAGETTGAVVGAGLWLVFGRRITAWLRAFAVERRAPRVVENLLLLYCVVFFASQIVPLDLTLNLADLAHKYRSGTIVLVPFSYVHGSWLSAAWDYLGDAFLNAPLGAAAVMVWTPPGERRPPMLAFAIAAAAVGAIELCQLFVLSRYADVTDVLTGSTGAAFGVYAASSLADGGVVRRVVERPQLTTRLSRAALPVWVALLAAYHWWPFDFTVSPAQVAEGVRRLTMIPLLSYYQGSEFHAFTEMTRKAVLAAPLGLLLGWAWPSRSGASRLRTILLAVAGFLILLSIELGQVFLRTRFPDVTDTVVGEVGIGLGLWVSSLATAAVASRRREKPAVGASGLGH